MGTQTTVGGPLTIISRPLAIVGRPLTIAVGSYRMIREHVPIVT